MFLDDKSIKNKKSNHHINLFSSTLKQNVIQQAASMLLQHVTFHKNLHHITQNNNGNALDEHHLSLHSIQRNRKEFRRTDKCNSWLSRLSPTKSDTSLNRVPIFVDSSHYQHKSRDYPPSVPFYPQIKHSAFTIPSRFHQNQITLSSNAVADINEPIDSFSQPLIMVHKKRLRRDYFLSTMQNCIQPPYSENHFYAFDQTNMLKLQRSLHRNNYSNPKRKYSEVYGNNEPECICSETQFNQTSPSKRNIPSPIEQSSPKTADHISINKYHDEQKSPSLVDDKSEIDIQYQSSEQSHRILSRLEKILNLCGELRSLAKDVEDHLHQKTTSSLDNNEKNQLKKSQSEQTIIDIYKELEIQQTINDINEKNTPPPYQHANETSSIHSQTDKSDQLLQTESFRTKSPTLRRPEDICSCFLKSFFEKQNCELNPDEQEYLNELTKAYLLGREQYKENNKSQTFIDKNLPEEQNEFDINNNNQSMTSVNPSSILFYNNPQQSSIPSEVTSIKHKMFFNEPILMKTTNILPGIGTKYAQQLAECGFLTVRRLLGFYLMIKDDQHFVIWLNNKAGISIHSAWLCTNTLRTWCQTHL